MADEYSLLLVDDDPAVIAALGKVLQEFGCVRFACSGSEALRLAHQLPPDLVLLDIELPGMDGFEVFNAMKASPTLAEVPIIFLTSHDDVEREVKALSLGAADFISKPPRPAQVVARLRLHLRMQQMTGALKRAASTDALTGLANRRQFDDALQREWLRAQRNASPVSLLMIDVDHFKAYNDHHGHPAGDQCLRAIAQALHRVVHRPSDLLARYGGEEFVLLLPDTDARGACSVARYALHEVRRARLPHARSQTAEHVTISVGVASHEGLSADCPELQREPRVGAVSSRGSASDLVSAADLALYACKAGGRNHARFLATSDRGDASRALDLRGSDSFPPSALQQVRTLSSG